MLDLGLRSHGRLKETWLRTAEKERTALGFGSWNQATVAALDHVTWRTKESVWPYTYLGSWSKPNLNLGLTGSEIALSWLSM